MCGASCVLQNSSSAKLSLDSRCPEKRFIDVIKNVCISLNLKSAGVMPVDHIGYLWLHRELELRESVELLYITALVPLPWHFFGERTK